MRIDGSSFRSVGQFIYDIGEGVMQRVDEYAYCFFSYLLSKLDNNGPVLRDNGKESVQISQDRGRLEKEKWDQEIQRGIQLPQMNLSLSEGINVMSGDGKEPPFYVKLPRSQVMLFPPALHRHLLNIEEDRLNIYFAVYFLEDHKKELALSVPKLIGKEESIWVGFYGGDGVSRGSGNTVPWYYQRMYLRSEIKDFTLTVTEDVGAFQMGSYLADCKGPYEGVALFGLVFRNQGIRDLLHDHLTLQELVNTIGGGLTEIFTYNDSYR